MARKDKLKLKKSKTKYLLLGTDVKKTTLNSCYQFLSTCRQVLNSRELFGSAPLVELPFSK